MKHEALRKLPQQARSRKRFNQILDMAAQIFEEMGYEATSTELIAERANTSIGSIYRFFPDKAAIVYALAERYAEQMQSLFATYFHFSAVHSPLDKIVGDTIDAFDDFYTKQPGCRVIMLQSLISPEIQEINKRADHMIIEQMDAFFAVRNPKIDAAQRKLAALVSIEIANTLQLWALTQDDKFRRQIIEETKKVIIRYLETMF
ncbi:MAG: TetR/AcrR family transcriptional regulator [Okeania sp. SIO3H1]|uniref:TetR/AcrR family transcriptional regulator n=1 Tax=Okeania sp. SIO1I7 TaxID=2607772 RepID=UPI0013C6566F|nr:TetR/AcrR family transcriptional regulator [Okeania sp. SIO1I7]NEN88951.1 TetR/AcrR family transcriptional regulator [Okeania sp. SIO3H1]NET28993.1 TetR/AcrR family transcriptional regulator [Okeania sp. SIO1I7]